MKSTRYTLGKGRYEYHFGVDFSLLSRYTRAELRLDPSAAAAQRLESTYIYYIICVTVKGCGLFRRQVRKSMCLKSVLLDPPRIPCLVPSRRLSRAACQVLLFSEFGLEGWSRREDNDEFPPPYSPVIALQAGISSDDGLLYAGDSIPLRLWITVPFVAQRKLDVRLKSIRIFLVDPNVVSVGGRRVVDLVGNVIREVQLDIPLQTKFKDEVFEVDPRPWKSCEVPQTSAETRSLSEVSRPFLLQVLCELSCAGMSSTMVW